MLRLALVLFIGSAVTACGGDMASPDAAMNIVPDTGSRDGGRDAGPSTDASPDTGAHDASIDGGLDAASIDGGSDAGSDAGSDRGSDAGHDGGTDGGSDAGHDAAASGPTLTINNFAAWCTVTADGTPVIDALPHPETAGAVVHLHGQGATGFIWGFWVGTDGHTSTHDTAMDTTITMSASHVVTVCCPFPDGTGCEAF